MAKRSSSLNDFKAFLEEFQGPEIKPVYAFFGEETFFLDRLQDAAIGVIPEESRDFNLDVLYGDEVKADKVITMCRSYPMMAERRAVIVRDFMKMFDPRRSDQETSDNESGEISLDAPDGGSGAMDDFVGYLKQPNPSTLLFLTNARRPAANTRIGAALKKSKTMTSHTFEPVDEMQLPKWIMEWAAMEHQLAFDDQAVQLLAFHVGNNLQQLTVEIEKLASGREKDQSVTDADVRKLVGLSREYTMFDFQDALFDKNTDKAMMIAHQMMKRADNQAGEVIRIISYLYAIFGKLWHIQRLARKGLTPVQIREAAAIKSTFYYDKLMRAGRKYPLASCPWLFEVLLDADKAIKGFSRQAPEAILFMTIKKITS
jgi:DNA polymerase III subunit delta